MGASAVGYILRTNLSIAAPAIKSELGLTETQLGLVLSAFVTTYALGQIPGGLVGERFGARRLLSWLLTGWGVVTLLTGVLPSHTVSPTWLIVAFLLVLRSAMGLLQAPLFPVMTGGTVRRWLPARQWALASSLQNTAYTLASGAAAPIGVWLVLRFGWRMANVLGAPLAFGLAVLWWWDTRDNPADHPRLNEAERELIRTGAPAVSDSADPGWLVVATNRETVLLALSYFSLNYVFYMFFNWFYYYLTDVRLVSPKMAGYFIGTQWIVSALAALAGGLLCDWLSARFGPTLGCRLTAMGGILFAAPCLLVGAVASSPAMMVILLSISAGSTQLVDAAYWVAALHVAGRRAQLSTGILNTFGNLSGSLAAILVPTVAHTWGWAAAIGSGTVFAVIAALLWLGIRADRPIAAEHALHRRSLVRA